MSDHNVSGDAAEQQSAIVDNTEVSSNSNADTATSPQRPANQPSPGADQSQPAGLNTVDEDGSTQPSGPLTGESIGNQAGIQNEVLTEIPVSETLVSNDTNNVNNVQLETREKQTETPPPINDDIHNNEADSKHEADSKQNPENSTSQDLKESVIDGDNNDVNKEPEKEKDEKEQLSGDAQNTEQKPSLGEADETSPRHTKTAERPVDSDNMVSETGGASSTSEAFIPDQQTGIVEPDAKAPEAQISSELLGRETSTAALQDAVKQEQKPETQQKLETEQQPAQPGVSAVEQQSEDAVMKDVISTEENKREKEKTNDENIALKDYNFEAVAKDDEVKPSEPAKLVEADTKSAAPPASPPPASPPPAVATPSEQKDATIEVDKDAANGEEKQEAKSELSENATKAADKGIDENESKEQDINSIPQLHKIVLPSYASWFSQKKINAIEIRSLPEFFNLSNKSKTPLIYFNYRNFMVNTYRLNPNEYLTLTAVRRNLAGDVGALLRIHRFLNKWGIINYQVNAEHKVYNVEPPQIANPKISYDYPRGLFPFESYTLPSEKDKVKKIKELVGVEHKQDPEAANGDADKKTLDKSQTNGDASKPQKRQKILKSDYNSDWSSLELKKLLVALQDNQSESSTTDDSKLDWYAIASFVGTKTPEQCIARFLQLPIEDSFLELLEKDGKDLLGPLKFAPNFPYSKADNPVISTIAFLTSLVDKEVVAESADRAIRKIDEKYLQKLKDEITEQEKQNGLSAEQQETDSKPESADQAAKDGNNNTGKEDVDMKDEEDTSALELTGPKHGSEDKAPLSSNESLKRGITTAIASMAGRSYLFSKYEEKQLNQLVSVLINQQLDKVDLKLNRLTAGELDLELQKKTLASLQEEILLERLSFSKLQRSIQNNFQTTYGELTDIIKNIKQEAALSTAANGVIPNGEEKLQDQQQQQQQNGDIGISSKQLHDKLLRIEALLLESNTLLKTSSKYSLFNNESLNGAATVADGEATKANSEEAEDIKPISTEAPHLYKFWAG